MTSLLERLDDRSGCIDRGAVSRYRETEIDLHEREYIRCLDQLPGCKTWEINAVPRLFHRSGKADGMTSRALAGGKTAARRMRGLLPGRPTFPSEGKCMIAGNFLVFTAEVIFDTHGHVYAESGCELSGRPLPCESGADVDSDVALVNAVLQKDRKATADFVNAYTDAVYSFI